MLQKNISLIFIQYLSLQGEANSIYFVQSLKAPIIMTMYVYIKLVALSFEFLDVVVWVTFYSTNQGS